jgi:hypothetical protein
MEIRITHREDHPRAGCGVQVRLQDPAMPVLKLSAPTLAGLQLLLEHVLEGRHPRTTQGRRDCPRCRQGQAAAGRGRRQP